MKGIIPPLGIVLSMLMWFALSEAVTMICTLRARATTLMDAEQLRDLPLVGIQPTATPGTRRIQPTPQIMPILFIVVWPAALIMVWRFTPDY